MPKRFYNAHAHCFTYDHVPEFFITKIAALSWLLKRQWLRKLVRAPFTGQFGLVGFLIKAVLAIFLKFDKSMFVRFINFVIYGDKEKQEDVIKSIQHYYPASTGYILLTMDMEYMGAGLPIKRFEKQLSELEGIKRNPEWENKVFPFIFCDPRRINPIHRREMQIEDKFIRETFLSRVRDYLREGIYHGIKIYPALGFYPFDKRMKAAYDYAVENNIPIMTHCTVGAVHFKYKLDEEELYHPFKKTNLPALKPSLFQRFYTHPLNYECLLNQKLLKTYWGDDAPDYSQLKVCLAHWGSGDEWKKFIKDAWSDTKYRKKSSAYPSLEIDNWHVKKENHLENFSWFSIVCDLIRKYPNVYADISYTLNDASLLPLLKMILEADSKIKSRVLFGTDFYMVSKAISEREFAINIRAALGKELFEQIAITNTENYLNNNFYPMPVFM